MSYWVHKFTRLVGSTTAEAFLAQGALLVKARQQLKGKWIQFLNAEDLPVKKRTVQRHLKIAMHPWLADATNL